MFHFETARRSRKPSLTPMIDVVFLLLVFFMLAARFGQDMLVPLSAAGGDTAYSGPPRLVVLSEDGTRLNGARIDPDAIAEALAPLMNTSDDTIFVQPRGESDLQDLVDVLDALSAAGYTSVVVVSAQ
ncbi:MAG: biopolymer transporter ExbD [Roseobacter sp.]|jgi:biopolymer transport protein ExbD|nr:biopolymer transporter ExbD [Roseobacter sp.]